MGWSCQTVSPEDNIVKVPVPVYLNVYDLTTINAYSYWFGLGIFHSAIQVYDVEYAFGAHEFSSSGVFEVEPTKCPGFIYRKTIKLGNTNMGPLELRSLIENVAHSYNGDTYHLLLKNCNHFTEDVSLRLTGHTIPGWVNRLARVGWLCRCFLPECIQLSISEQIPEVEHYEVGGEKKDIMEDGNEHEHEQRLLSGENSAA